MNDSTQRELARRMAEDSTLTDLTRRWKDATRPYRYTYGFTWLGIPVIQHPQDVMAWQEILWRVRPDLVVETGVAHGGSLVLSASMLELIGHGRVLGVDIDIRPHNRAAIEAHKLAHRISLIQGSSIDQATADAVYAQAKDAERVIVVLDSNHTHEHVLRELELYSPLVKKGSYLLVFDTAIEDCPEDAFPDRPWGKGNNPKTAVREFLKTNKRFEVDRDIEDRLVVSAAPEGYLRCIAD
ncbi:MAG: cephalosporin hydroxylase family protein [Humidesulfovibrio sp.]|uniref:cephalosporin hydroxylase family protein n=1 Tax=Humidesulfovibrio sp. TaxID=2910988 RepID=UPI0027FE87FD|nr:cephalosporin hydroxylase family protein [Humidesulfovibrio sp.]MDQ7834827.1 cephalosporin hydroxylase family protein [Humidesulfovibrio sp.]